MGLVRVAILLAVSWAAVKLYRHWRTPPPPPRSNTIARKTVKCRVCGVYVPESEAIKVGDHAYCSVAHQREGGAR